MKKTELLQFSGAALMIVGLLFIGFPALEPIITSGAATSTQFTVTQYVTAEISFAEEPADVIMSPSLGGISGGNSYGSTTVRVVTNNTTGYNMTLLASSTASGHALQGTTTSGYIPDFRGTATTVPSYTFSVAANRAAFGYTVSASTTADLAQQFLDNGSLCNIAIGDGGTDTSSGTCWADASTTLRTIINSSAATAASGSTSTIAFRVTINSNPVPAIPEDGYVATMTLTATTN